MATAIGITIIWLIFLALVGMAAFVYLDASEYGLAPKKWAAITLFVPFFGFFAYVFERGERIEDPDWEQPEDAFVDGTFSIHKSRAGDVGWVSDEEAPTDEEVEETGEADS